MQLLKEEPKSFFYIRDKRTGELYADGNGKPYLKLSHAKSALTGQLRCATSYKRRYDYLPQWLAKWGDENDWDIVNFEVDGYNG